MSDETLPPDGDKPDQALLPGAIVGPFAQAVAAELEEFGLSKSKIDEIIVRSAARLSKMSTDNADLITFGAISAPQEQSFGLGWFSDASKSTYQYIASVASRHGPDLVESLAPVVREALRQAITSYVENALKPNTAPRNKKKSKS